MLPFIAAEKPLVRIIAILVLIFSSASFAFLKTNGTVIVDSTGNEILLRGYGLGGWLVPEGYMLNVPGFGSPTSIRLLIEDLIGSEDTETFYAAYESNYVAEADIEQIAGWGFNSIRLPFHYNQLYDESTGEFREAGFQLFDTVIDWCKTYNLYLILDMHCAPGGQSAANISDSDGIEARLWTEPENQVLAIRIWKEIAARYADETVIGGYDIINEPVLPDGFTNQPLRDFYEATVDTIRTVDQNHIVFIEGNWYATNFDLLTPPFDDNMVYSFHKYWSETDLGSIQSYLSMRAQHEVPLWMGESGENSNPWYYEAIQLFEDNNIGWCWWAHKKLATINSPYSAPISPEYQTVLDYWNGSAGEPSHSFAFDALMGMAESLKLEHCEFNYGVLKALTDPAFNTTPEPFTDVSLPGTIDAINYDHGNQGIGYIDSGYRNIGGTSWNNGWVYRNDGVDIEPCEDNQGPGYNVGWIDGGERLMYTVNIEVSGLYEIHFRVASLDGGGNIILFEDNTAISGAVSIPATGGWQNWQTVSVENIPLSAGSHQLMLLCAPGLFNLNTMTFFLTAVGIDDSEAVLPDQYALDPNYPNPFNPETRFGFRISDFGLVEINIYDVQGRHVRRIMQREMAPGEFTAGWDGTDDTGAPVPSGVYFYSLMVKSATGQPVADPQSSITVFQQTRRMLLIK